MLYKSIYNHFLFKDGSSFPLSKSSYVLYYYYYNNNNNICTSMYARCMTWTGFLNSHIFKIKVLNYF